MNNLKILHVGFIGSGKTASEHAKVIKKFKKYYIKSVFSKTEKNAKKFAKVFKIKNYYDDINLFLKEKYDLLIICLPPDKLFNVLKKILKTDSNIFIEKPLGLNFNEANKIYKIYKKKKLKFFVGYNRRFLGSVVKLKKKISVSKNKLFLYVQDQQDTNIAKKYGHNKKVIKNWMYANSIHTIDLISFFLRGNPIKFENKNILKNKKKVITSKILFSSGDQARYVSYWNIPANWKISILSKNSFFQLNPLEKLEININGKNKLFANFVYDRRFKPGFYRQFEEIDKALKNKKNCAVTLFDAIKSVHVTKKIYEKFK